MSLSELRREAARCLRLDHKLEEPALELPLSRAFPCSQDVIGVRMLPGGEHVIMLSELQLELRSVHGGDSLIGIPLPGDSWAGNFTLLKFDVLVTARGEVRVLIHVAVHRG